MQSHEFNALRQALSDDMDFHTVQLSDNRESLNVLRSYIRAVFSYIEGNVNGFKSISLKISNEEYGIQIKENEERKLRNVKLDKQTEEERESYITAKDNLSLALKSISTQHECDYVLNKQSNDSQNYLTSIKIRDRLTHPKSIQDFKVSEEDLAIVESTYNWFINEIRSLGESIDKVRRRNYA